MLVSGIIRYVYLFSRTKSRKTGELVEKSENFPHIKEWAEMFVPKGTIFVGEIYIPGGHSNTVTKLSGCLPAKAYKRQFDKTDPDYLAPARYYVFDIIRYCGEDIQEKGTLDRIENYLYSEELEYTFANQEYVERAETFYDNFEEHLQRIFSEGGEGIVFKNKTCPYRAGKRSTSSQMFKWKQHLDSVDLICIGLEDPIFEYSGKEIETWPYWETTDTKEVIKSDQNHYGQYGWMPITKPYYLGWKSSIGIGAYDDAGNLIELGTVSSGLTDEDKAAMGADPSAFVGKVVALHCMSIDCNEKTLRHPVFKSWRDDKNAADCTIKTIFG